MKAPDALRGPFVAAFKKAPRNRTRSSGARSGHVRHTNPQSVNVLWQKCSNFSIACSKHWHSKPTVEFGDCNVMQRRCCFLRTPASQMSWRMRPCNVQRTSTELRSSSSTSFTGQTRFLSHLAEAPKWQQGPVPVTLESAQLGSVQILVSQLLVLRNGVFHPKTLQFKSISGSWGWAVSFGITPTTV